MSKKRKSKILSDAEARAAALRSIEQEVNFGPDLNLQVYLERIADGKTRLANYNDMAARLDSERIALREAEAIVGDLSSRMLQGALARCGRNSQVVKMAGGKLKSERKRRSHSNPTPQNPPQDGTTTPA